MNEKEMKKKGNKKKYQVQIKVITIIIVCGI